MRIARYPATLLVKVENRTRTAVEDLATKNGQSLGEVTRDILNAGMKALGVECS